jgi:hypothetical protein
MICWGIFGGMVTIEMDGRVERSGFLPMIGIPVSPGIQIGVSQQVHRRPRKAALAPATAAFLFAGVCCVRLHPSYWGKVEEISYMCFGCLRHETTETAASISVAAEASTAMSAAASVFVRRSLFFMER